MNAALPGPAFWKGRRVFLTGHTGFKGSWLSLWLGMLGAEVTGYALAPSSHPSMFELAGVQRNMHSTIGDIRNAAGLATALREAAPDVVIHMAAQPLVRLSYTDPVATYATNVMGTVHLLDAVRSTPSVRAVVIVTTDKCYENREWVWSYREQDTLGGFDPYSNSKACAELVTQSFRDAFFPLDGHARHGVAIASARAGNVIGGGDWSVDRLVPDLVRAADAGGELELRNPDAIRPWQHVLEPLAGYLVLAEALTTRGVVGSGAWNFGPRESDIRSVGEVATALARQWPKPVDCRLAPESATVHEARILKLDSSKASSVLGWRPRWTLDHTLVSIARWHAAHQRGEDIRCETERQIEEYTRSPFAGDSDA